MGVKSKMTQTPESEKKANDMLKPRELPSPRRGAFPTPKAEIESAKPYIPDLDQTDNNQPPEPDSPTNADAGGKIRRNLKVPDPK
jgi:hypothetical protein